MKKPLDNNVIIQLGFIVSDVEKTKKSIAEFLGVEPPETVESGEYEVTKTVYRGEPAPKAKCKMTFFKFGDLQVEFIEPNKEESAWKEYLDTKGEGLHHLAFGIKGMDGAIEKFKSFDVGVVQKGEYRNGNGRYAFFDTFDTLKFYLELLESDE